MAGPTTGRCWCSTARARAAWRVLALRPGLALEPRLRGRRAAARAAAPAGALADEGARARGGGAARHRRGRRDRDRAPHARRDRAAGHRDEPLGRELARSTLTETAPGRWQGRIEDAENGVWRLENGDQHAVAVVGPSAPKEFENPVSTGDVLAPLADATRGGVQRLEDGLPDMRLVREGRVAEGRGWIGLADREAYQLRDIRQVDLAPGWLTLLLAAGLVFAAWRIEGR